MSEEVPPTSTPDSAPAAAGSAATTDSPPAPAPPPVHKRHRVRRAVVWICGLIVALLLLIVLVTQIVLMTDFPRRLVLSLVQKQLGLQVDAKSLSTGWFGHTTLREVTVSLPLSDKAFLTAPTLRVNHTNLPWLLLTRSITLQKITFDQPELTVRQSPSGGWNLLDAATLIARAGGGQSPNEKKSGPPTLPALEIVNATVHILDNQGRQQTIASVQVSGKPAGPLVYVYDARALPQLQVKGEVALGGNWQHKVQLQLEQLGPWVRPWIKNWPNPVKLAADWTGQVGKGSRITGRLELKDLSVAQYQLSGVAKVVEQDGTVTLEPQPLVLKTPQKLAPDVNLHGGRLVVNTAAIQSQGLRVGVAQGQVQLDGRYAFAEGAASLEAMWQDLTLPGEINTAGHLNAHLTQPWPGQPVIDATLQTTGQTTYGDWNTTLTLSGQGPAWSNMDWTVRAPTLAFQRPPQAVAAEVHPGFATPVPNTPVNPRGAMHANDLVIHLATRGRTITLNDLSVAAGARIAGRGAYNLDGNKWWLYVDSGGWPVNASGATLGFSVDAWGNPDYITLHQFYIHSGAMELVAHGFYGFSWPRPVYVRLYGTHPPTGDEPRIDVPIHGRLIANADLTGTVAPMNLSVAGDLAGRDIQVLNHPLGDIAAQIAGAVDKAGVKLGTQVKLFDGLWELKASFPEHNNRLNTRVARAWASVKGLSLEQVGQVLGRKDILGTADGNWTFDIPKFSPSAILMSGNLTAHNAHVGPLAAEQVTAQTYLQEGQLLVDPIVLRQGKEQGQANGTLSLDLAHPRRVRAALAAAAWQVNLPNLDATLLVNGGTRGPMTLDLANLTADGRATVAATLAVQNKQAATVSVNLALHPLLPADDTAAEELTQGGRGKREMGSEDKANARRAVRSAPGTGLQNVHLSRLDAVLLGGTIKGNGQFIMKNLADAADIWGWQQVQANLRWQGLDADQLPTLLPNHPLHDLGGKYSGQAIVEHTDDPRALEPHRLRFQLNSEGGHYRSLQIGSSTIFAYFGEHRFVFSGSPDERSVLYLADGEIYPWLRISRPGRDYYTLMQFTFERLSLDQMIHAVDPKRKATPGRIAGEATVFGDLRQKDRLTGDASLRVTDSDLVNIPALSLLYNVMNVGTAGSGQAIGHGGAEAHLEQSTLTISNARYFNRGVDAHGNITFGHIFSGPQTTLNGAVVGTSRSFKDLRLPLLADADQIFAVLQSAVTTVSIKGTLGKPDISLTNLNDVGQTLKDILIGDVKSQKQGS
jgi:hypothetical protein